MRGRKKEPELHEILTPAWKQAIKFMAETIVFWSFGPLGAQLWILRLTAKGVKRLVRIR